MLTTVGVVLVVDANLLAVASDEEHAWSDIAPVRLPLSPLRKPSAQIDMVCGHSASTKVFFSSTGVLQPSDRPEVFTPSALAVGLEL